MATGGSKPDLTTCAVCLRSFRDPKFLPCFHTFCALCIQGVADKHAGADFPCPTCCTLTSLPPAGVFSLATNLYLQTPTPAQQQQPAGSSTQDDMCKIHSDEKLRFYCVTCDEACCRDCKLLDHEQHQAEDLNSAASRKKTRLQTDQQRLQHAEHAVKEVLASLEEERRSVETKRAAVEKSIRNRHAVVVAAADAKRDELLLSLQSLSTDLDEDVGRALQQQEGRVEEVLTLRQQVIDAITSGTASDVITVAKEMRSGRGSVEAVTALTSQEERTLHRPLHRFSVNTDDLIEKTREFLGTVTEMELEKPAGPEVKVTERFQCAPDPNAEVFSLCHLDTAPPRLNVSFERCGMKKDAPKKTFTETGKSVYTHVQDQVGKLCYKRVGEGLSMYRVSSGSEQFTTYSKNLTAGNFQLVNSMSGLGYIDRVTVTSTDPFQTDISIEFRIQVGPHRAFDVDDAESYFAVVEEAKKSAARRSVRLYRRSVERPVSTYIPPTAAYQPSDVCFYSLGGRKVLLITDELNDAIHVASIDAKAVPLSVQGETHLRFERYLCAGCPSLIQPTAITVDFNSRLWVACRGGAVLMIEQIN